MNTIHIMQVVWICLSILQSYFTWQSFKKFKKTKIRELALMEMWPVLYHQAMLCAKQYGVGAKPMFDHWMFTQLSIIEDDLTDRMESAEKGTKK